MNPSKFTAKSNNSRWFWYPLGFLAGLAAIIIALVILMGVMAYPNLPSLDVLTDYQPKMPLRVYTADHQLIGEFGEERRNVVRINEVPSVMKQAILAAEDERFYQHGGVDTWGVMRAAIMNMISGGKRQGASTITMQVARNFFLSREKTLNRKLYEVLLAFKIEKSLSKDEILQLYINQIYLGQRAYGFASAAQIYFGKTLNQLSAAEAAMLAGLPKAPSAYNPVVNPQRARLRQQYVLRRMRELDFLSEAQYQAALNQELVVKRDASDFNIHAEHVAEMARQMIAEEHPDDAYTAGYEVITTIRADEQEAAYRALRQSVMEYDRRHGYRGAESFVDLRNLTSDRDEALDELLQDIPGNDDLPPAIVLEADPKLVKVYRRGGEIVQLSGENLKFAANFIDEKTAPNKRIRRGAIVRLSKNEKGVWQIAQLPEVESAFVSINPKDGAVRALVGGFDFSRNQFNHATQAWRQPGSSFKPFIYSASLEKGFGPATVIADEPISFEAAETGSQAWQPHNYDGKYEGPMRMRSALAKSKNMVSIRILQSITPQYAQQYATRFGFEAGKHPPYLTMALGAGSVTPWQMARAYAVFANGGYLLEPYVVQEIRTHDGKVLNKAEPPLAGNEDLRTIEPRNAFVMDSMLRDVTIYGTAARASATLKRRDLAGKTGTTNEYVDAWFCGYQIETASACAWTGFDKPKKLGSGETGGQASLPTWIGYMKQALKDVPQKTPSQPEGLTTIGGELYYPENVSSAAQDVLPVAETPPAPPPLNRPPSD